MKVQICKFAQQDLDSTNGLFKLLPQGLIVKLPIKSNDSENKRRISHPGSVTFFIAFWLGPSMKYAVKWLGISSTL